MVGPLRTFLDLFAIDRAVSPAFRRAVVNGAEIDARAAAEIKRVRDADHPGWYARRETGIARCADCRVSITEWPKGVTYICQTCMDERMRPCQGGY